MTTRMEMPALPVRKRQGAPWVQRSMIFLTLVVAADCLFGERGLAARMRLMHEMATARTELAAAKNENAGLREQIQRLESDPGAIEALAREELGLIRRDELLFLIAR